LVFIPTTFGAITSTLDPVGPKLWNARASFYILGIEDIGTHMTVIQLESGKYLVIDTIELQPLLKQQLDTLTSNGSQIEAVVATHPFHTVYFPAFYQAYPKVPFYGTPRHLKNQPSIPWAGNVSDPKVRSKWPEVQMRIPAGAEFVAPTPESSNHFAGMFVFRNGSNAFHIDDTVMYAGKALSFHPSLASGGICPFESSPYAFRDFMVKLIGDWDFDNILAAHSGRMMGGAKVALSALVKNTEPTFDELTKKYAGKSGICQ